MLTGRCVKAPPSGELAATIGSRLRGFVPGLRAKFPVPPAPLPGGELPPQRLRGFRWRTEKKSLSEAARFFPVRPLLWGLKGASSPFLVGPARRNRWHFSGSLLVAKENIPGGDAFCKRHETFNTRNRSAREAGTTPAERPARLRGAETFPAAPLRRRMI